MADYVCLSLGLGEYGPRISCSLLVHDNLTLPFPAFLVTPILRRTCSSGPLQLLPPFRSHRPPAPVRTPPLTSAHLWSPSPLDFPKPLPCVRPEAKRYFNHLPQHLRSTCHCASFTEEEMKLSEINYYSGKAGTQASVCLTSELECRLHEGWCVVLFFAKMVPDRW